MGRSLVVGKPTAMMLDRENATVTICNSRTQNLPAICKEADVVVVAMGKMGAVGADCLREGPDRGRRGHPCERKGQAVR